MNVHFMAVPADRMIAVDIPVAVYKILHVTVVLLTTRHDITEIHCFCFNEQCEKLWGIERSGFFNGREKWAKGFENQRV